MRAVLAEIAGAAGLLAFLACADDFAEPLLRSAPFRPEVLRDFEAVAETRAVRLLPVADRIVDRVADSGFSFVVAEAPDLRLKRL